MTVGVADWAGKLVERAGKSERLADWVGMKADSAGRMLSAC